jgi:hypothetical protein
MSEAVTLSSAVCDGAEAEPAPILHGAYERPGIGPATFEFRDENAKDWSARKPITRAAFMVDSTYLQGASLRASVYPSIRFVAYVQFD